MFTISNLNEIAKQEESRQHPWARFIKDAYANKIKTAHNSIKNPDYPKKTEKPTKKHIERVKFTVVGNRVTKEFIYCINLVKGLHKYRKKHFECPVIRGVTGVDWPSVLNDLKIQYGSSAYCLTSQVVVFLNDKIIGGEKELKEFIEQDYSYHFALNYYKESVAQFANFIKGSGRPTVFMHIAIDDEHIGTMIFMLYSDVVPYTCENFMRLCQARRGGYSGTPVHRIVKDGWIQCGGFGLKSTKLDCENFIVPPDKRGVLCMANDGRHVDCSTQFFVLLQPLPWMLHKYVAFGQLIDGDSTLRKIENVETWYESPKKNIIIYKAGILNIDCQDIMINRGAHEYIFGHIEDLFALGETLWEELLARVFLEIQIRENPPEEMGEGEDQPIIDLNLHATKRFMKKGIAPQARDSVQPKSHKSKSQDESKSTRIHYQEKTELENNDFDVSEYDYEPEEYSYKHKLISVKHSESEGSLVVKPEKPYYIPLTDVPYPGEVSSEYDLQKFLRGDYCLETDLEVEKPEKAPCVHKVVTFPAGFFNITSRESSYGSEQSLDSDQEAELTRFLKNYTDNTCFAGDVVRGISKGKHNPLLSNAQKAALTDDELRTLRLVKWEEIERGDDRNEAQIERLGKEHNSTNSADANQAQIPSTSTHRATSKPPDVSAECPENKKVSIVVPEHKKSTRINRRQTGFVMPSNWERNKPDISTSEDDYYSTRRVRMDPSLMGSTPTPAVERRPTAFVRPGAMDSDSDINIGYGGRPSVLARLLEEQRQCSLPTLRDYRPSTSYPRQSMLLTNSTNFQMSSDGFEHYRDHTIKENALMSHKKSQNTMETHIRFPLKRHKRARPSITVSEYQAKSKPS